MSSYKKAPVQGMSNGIPWEVHMMAYEVYCERYGPQQALIEGDCRGGFSTGELDMFLPNWRRLVVDISREKLGINK